MKAEPIWIEAKEAKFIHELQIDIFGGKRGIRDENLLESALARPKQKWTYAKPSLFDLAAAYGYGIAKNHPFIDGNKRTAFVILATFLEINNFILEVPETEVVLTMEKLPASTLNEDELATWLEKNSSQINN
ncbi:MAG: type II toxin-antitoxin system death-on-curing family toxin [Prochloraceae cyanobacterium]